MTKLASIVFLLAACSASTKGGGGGGGGSGSGGGGGGPGGGSGGGSGGGGGMSATEFVAAVDKLDCDEAFTCKASYVPTTAGDTFDDEWGTTNAQCYSDSADIEMPAVLEADISAGKIHYDGTKAAPCLAAIVYTTCADFWANGSPWPDACDNVIAGTLADGAACVIDWECSGDTSICDETTMKCAPDTTARLNPGSHVERLRARLTGRAY